jgi:coenzyme F420-0:L-glutamate ligase/coenzyme F420-1:gamma-L-glutamate ligase
MPLQATWLAVADAAAAATELLRAKNSGQPVVVIEGLERYLSDADGPGAAALVRASEEDLFT